MRKIEINYQNTTELISNLMTILTHLDFEKESVKKALNGINDLENNHTYESQIIYDLEYGLNQINRDIQDTEDLIKSINTFSKNIQETESKINQNNTTIDTTNTEIEELLKSLEENQNRIKKLEEKKNDLQKYS